MLNSIYNDSIRYDDIHWWKKDDIEFWSKIYSDDINGKKVLELASGTGRLAHGFLRDGAEFTGIELSNNFVVRAKKKLNNIGIAPDFLVANMCDFYLNKKFDLIFIGFNSFLHLLTDKEALSCLACVAQHMHINSRFIIDIFIPNPLFLYRPEGVRFKVLEYIDSTTNQSIVIEESNIYCPDTEINKLTWYFSSLKQKDYTEEHFSMRMYYPSKMNQLLIDAGFNILNQWGDYYKTPLNESSKLQIYNLCLK